MTPVKISLTAFRTLATSRFRIPGMAEADPRVDAAVFAVRPVMTGLLMGFEGMIFWNVRENVHD